jgi:hypothetical protein
MKLSEKIKLVASWLEDSENDLLVNADSDNVNLEVVAEALTAAADILKVSAEIVGDSETGVITPESLDEMAALATAFDESGDELLKKQASVLDEILLTFGADKGVIEMGKINEDYRIEELKKKYQKTHELQQEMNKVSDSVKKIEDSPAYKMHRPMEMPLNSRYCPQHAGVPVVRIGEHEVQCILDKKVYNYETGYALDDGTKVPGGDVSLQTKLCPDGSQHTMFESRSEKLGMQ